ncbi:MAG: hypothetical protein P8Y60_20565, partial [Calditrichota bacterium]
MGTLDLDSALQVLKGLFESELLSDTEKTLLKETTIAIDVFGKNADFNPAQDSIVRSYIYNLRKKLKEYYLTTGKNDSIQLIIPKGHYRIDFIKNSNHNLSALLSDRNRLVLVGLLVLFTGLSIYLFVQNRTLVNGRTQFFMSPSQHTIWDEFIKSDFPTLIVFGDYFFYQETRADKQEERYVRSDKINSLQDLAAYIQMHPQSQSQFSEKSITFLGKEVPKSLSMILQELQQFRVPTRLALASELNWDDLKENNIIFIGHYQTLQILENYFTRLRYKYNISPQTIYYTPANADTLNSISLLDSDTDGFRHDYAVIAKFPGGSGNTILLICSFYSFGKVKATELISSPEGFTQTHSGAPAKLPPYFEMLVQIYGAGNL